MNRGAPWSILHSKVTNYFSMPWESYFLIKWEMIFRTSALLDFIPRGFARWWWGRVSGGLNGQGEVWSLSRRGAAPSENLPLSVSRAEITVQSRSAFPICQQHTGSEREREEARGEKKKRERDGEREAIGSMEYHLVSQWKTWLSEAGARGPLGAARDERSANLIGLLQEV